MLEMEYKKALPLHTELAPALTVQLRQRVACHPGRRHGRRVSAWPTSKDAIAYACPCAERRRPSRCST
jgi:hypothetical protein